MMVLGLMRVFWKEKKKYLIKGVGKYNIIL